MISAFITAAALALTFVLAKNTQFLMPGALTTAHGALDRCSACHTQSGDGKLSWMHGLIPGDRRADSKACLRCHAMPETAFNAHGTTAEALEKRARQQTAKGPFTQAPFSARAQSLAFPTQSAVAQGTACATCHQEHRGPAFNLKRISAEQCRSCHAIKFDSFDGHHPDFDGYPFRRRTRIIFDHAGHFGKHFPKAAEGTPARPPPETCSNCHQSSKTPRVMAVAPFDQTCSACHLDQIRGNQRLSGPKGIAFLTLPGLDLATLKKNKADIGEWPTASASVVTPFMKLLISRSERGRALIKAVNGLDLQDLTSANKQQIKAVADLAWEIKQLIYTLIDRDASDVLATIEVGGVAKLSESLIADLTASIPRDVIVNVHQEWLPNLATELANRSNAGDPAQKTAVSPPRSAPGAAQPFANQSDKIAGPKQKSEATGTPATTGRSPAAPSPPNDVAPSIPISEPASKSGERTKAKAADQTDDLLFPTEEELRAMKTISKDGRKPSPSQATEPEKGSKGSPIQSTASTETSAQGRTSASQPQLRPQPVTQIGRDIDPENWAAYGGWYRQDSTIFYRPVAHKDKFINAWLTITGPEAHKGATSPETDVFEFLTSKDAQGSCTKCHSVEASPIKGRIVNFTPMTVANKKDLFTTFTHEPHLSISDKRGCLSCHELDKGSSYLKSYEQDDPNNFTSNFAPVKRELCRTCHTSTQAGQDCQLCHKYHIHGTTTPAMSTKLPAQ